jgi:hypothetical protein
MSPDSRIYLSIKMDFLNFLNSYRANTLNAKTIDIEINERGNN